MEVSSIFVQQSNRRTKVFYDDIIYNGNNRAAKNMLLYFVPQQLWSTTVADFLVVGRQRETVWMDPPLFLSLPAFGPSQIKCLLFPSS